MDDSARSGFDEVADPVVAGHIVRVGIGVVAQWPSTEKAYVELRGASHFAGNSNPADQGAAMLTWLKRYVDNDDRQLTLSSLSTRMRC